jgi:NADPH-dependent 2,4-dienoyl-CoA reductase/sulfur reductase-like enzyme
MMKTIAVVGASVAGLAAARALRQIGYDGQLVLIGDEPHLPYDRPPLSKEFLAGVKSEADLSLQIDGEDLALDWRLGLAATGLDPATRTLHLSDGEALRPDGVVIATGARPRAMAGLRWRPGLHQLRTIDDARALRADLIPGARLVVVGAGFIGSEVASTARSLGVDVTVVEIAPTPLAAALGVEMGRAVSALHAANGVRLVCGVGVTAINGTDRVTGVELSDGTTVPADVVVIGVGVVPNVEWLEGSGLTLTNGVLCNAFGGTEVPGVVAVGDCASWYDPAAHESRRIEHWTNAREGAAIAAAWLLSGGSDTRTRRPPYFWSDQYGTSVRFAGSTAGFDELRIDEGRVDEHSFVAVYERAGTPIGVLSVGRDQAFISWRRRLRTREVADVESAG